MDMHIEIPSGKVFLNGRPVMRIHRHPYTQVGNVRRLLTIEEMFMARAMRKAFAPLCEQMGEDIE